LVWRRLIGNHYFGHGSAMAVRDVKEKMLPAIDHV
jgi:hypothetical protein